MIGSLCVLMKKQGGAPMVAGFASFANERFSDSRTTLPFDVRLSPRPDEALSKKPKTSSSGLASSWMLSSHQA